MVGRFGTALLKPANADQDAIPSIGEIGLNHFAPYLINRISARWTADMQEALKPFELTTAKMRTLAVLTITPGMTANDLALHTITEQSTMSRTLDTLEAQGLVRREQADADSRVRRVFLTDDGRAEFSRAWPAMHDGFEAMFDGIDDAEYAALIATLQKMLRNIRKHDI